MTTPATEPKKDPIFSTRDIYLASTLITLKFPLLGIDMQIEGIKPRPIGYFKFTDTDDLRTIKSDYNQGRLLVEPRLFMNNLQSLKAEVVNFAQNPNSELYQRP